MGNSKKELRQIAEAIVSREGGYVNDPDDPGGATNFGVTLGTLVRLGRDINRDGRIDQADVRRLSKGQAVDIFLAHYFDAPNLGALPVALQATVFDMYVNSGANAVKILQRLLGDMGLAVSVDGVVGPQTAEAAHRAMAVAPDHLVDAYGIARRNYYFDIADRRVKSRKFARSRAGGKGGWIKRAEEFISPRFHMSEAEFAKRVSAWG